jgi:hypothetical protein
MLSKCRDAVNKINALSEYKETDNEHQNYEPRVVMGGGAANGQETTRKRCRICWVFDEFEGIAEHMVD